MLNIPSFRPHLHVEVISGEGVLILSEKSARALHGRDYERLVPLIDGRRSTDEIVDQLSSLIDAARIYYVLNELEASGYLGEAASDIPVRVAAFWCEADIEPATAIAALREKRVAVQRIGGMDHVAMRAALATTGVKFGTLEQGDFWLILTDDHLRPELAAINLAALNKHRPWLLVRVTGRELWLGPIFQPNETGCWECMRRRLERNRAVHRFVAAKTGLVKPPFTAQAALPATMAAAYQMTAVATSEYLAGASNALVSKILSFDWVTQTSGIHTLVRHPYCPACGKMEEPVMQPIQLRPGKARFLQDGGHRSVAPEVTLKRYEHLISPITGIVQTLSPVRQPQDIAYVYMAGDNSAIRTDRLEHLKEGLRNTSSGKGISEIQARTSALCEAIERYSGELTGGELRVTRALRDWREGEAYHPNDVMLFSSRQYTEREVWNKKGSRFNLVPELLDDITPIDWTPLWSLTAKRHKFLPTQLIYYGAPSRAGDNTCYAIGCSNGNAAGNSLEEAILQGFFELVERDAVAVWWYNRLRKPGVSVDRYGDPFLLELTQHYLNHYRRETWALDLTSDLDIPVFAAVSKVSEGKEERLLFGLGCHLDPRIALQRSFTEMNQMRAIALTSDGDSRLDDRATLEWFRHATVANQPHMAPDPDQPSRQFDDFSVQHSGEFLQDIEYCCRIIEARGMEMLVLDQTRADVGMPVVKVVVPGLRHFWARFAPGRLYDVPVKMGWLNRPLKESELNPIPIFF
jgi:bacteriocin biosynthesis cyclodehydratase domain-containing protein